MSKLTTFVRVDDAVQCVRGILVGGANITPGVSGGTMALVLGIYQRLVTAISRCDTELIGLIRRRQWGGAARHVDLRFLVALAVGVAAGTASLGILLNELLGSDTTRPATNAALFGMIVASGVIVARWVRPRGGGHLAMSIALGVAGAYLAYWLTELPATTSEPTLVAMFVGGMVAICAMILPGISGAYLLMILGLYMPLTDLLKTMPDDLVHGRIEMGDVAIVAVFGCGCVVGLLSFSKVLRWLLAHWRSETMALLCGFMLGALKELWPFKVRTGGDDAHPVFKEVWPEAIDGQVVLCVVVALVALALVFALDRVGHRGGATTTSDVGQAR